MRRDKRRARKNVCAMCGRHTATQIHHIFGGSYRWISEREGFVMELCPQCHRSVHDKPALGDALKRGFERKWLRSHSLDAWMALMGRSWLLDDGE